MGFFRLLFIFLLAYFIIRFLYYVLRPKQKNFSTNHRNSERRNEGEITINKNKPSNKKIVDKNDGDYIDYEDV